MAIDHSTGPDRARRSPGALLLAAIARVLGHLPVAPQVGLGRLLGRLALRLAPRRRAIAETNLRLCFPDETPEARRRLLEAGFEATGLAVLETATAWTRDPRTLAGRLDLIGLHHVHGARRDGRGVLLVGCHLVTLEIAGALLSTALDFDVVERPHDDARLDALQQQGRRRSFGAVIDRDDVRTIVQRLRSGHCVWYAFDQDPGPGRGAFVPFFGVPAATLTTAPRLARAGRAAMLLVDHWREAATDRWAVRFTPLPTGLPTADPLAATATLVGAIEARVREHPEQYLWMHRRFKTRPPGEPSVY